MLVPSGTTTNQQSTNQQMQIDDTFDCTFLMVVAAISKYYVDFSYNFQKSRQVTFQIF